MTKRVLGVLAALSMLGVVACSGSDPAPAQPAGDAGGETATETGGEVGPIGDADAETPPPPPGDDTTGKACANADDCDTTGNQIAFCSNELFAVGPLNPTPVCLQLDASGANADVCEPSDDTTIRFCDGPTNVGLCQENGDGGPGVCEPMCQIGADGTVLQACAGKNACNPALFASGDDGKIVLIGTCQGGCVEDADCPGGSKCEPTQKLCVKTCTNDAACKSGWTAPSNWVCDTTGTPARNACHFKYDKKVGDVCKSSDECPCLMRTGDEDGVCTELCKTGGGTLPSGYVCDPLLPVKDNDGNALWTWTTPPAGIAGYAMKTCTTVGDKCDFGTAPDDLKTHWSCQAGPPGFGNTCQPTPAE